MTAGGETGKQPRRQAAMAVLAHSDTAAIAGCLGSVAAPAYEDLREPENGLVMVRDRIGGDGAPFNVGEATAARGVVRLASGGAGFGCAFGPDRQTARLVAPCA